VGSVVLACFGVDVCARMELLRDLMVQREHLDRCRRLEPQPLEQRDQVIGDSKVVTLGAPDFIVTEFERDRQPVPPSEGEPD
jgi:hypothetical protein